ncbi:MAG TPA: hypothetical protein VLH60_01235 [Sedimentisphaerales bacterium]|nr:hypothetical protein [Sedimentisphaerales bacterium]
MPHLILNNMGNTCNNIGFILVLAFAASAAAYDFHPSYFAVAAWYGDANDPNDWSDPNRPGAAIKEPVSPFDLLFRHYYDKPEAAIGPPTRMTRYDWFDNEPNEPVNPVFPPWRANELVTIGRGTAERPFCLVVRFEQPVADDRNNLHGIDFIVFGNAHATSSSRWPRGGDPTTIHIAAGLHGVPGIAAEPGIVSVSQDGLTWHTYSLPVYPRADSFPPTAAYRWDYEHNRWDVNSPLNPTRPVDPNLKLADLMGLTVAEVIDRYDGSAGGAGFDISVFGLPWIKYVKICDDPSNFGTTEIDAVADVSACGDHRHPFPPGDLNYDCRVDFTDWAIFGAAWVGNTADVILITENWLACTWECN